MRLDAGKTTRTVEQNRSVEKCDKDFQYEQQRGRKKKKGGEKSYASHNTRHRGDV